MNLYMEAIILWLTTENQLERWSPEVKEGFCELREQFGL